MPARYKLTALQVKQAKPGKHEDGGGLRLVKGRDGSASWVFRYSLNGRRREMGLGPLEYVSLKQARDEADKWRLVARKGRDPIIERQRDRDEAAAQANVFADIAHDCLGARRSSLKGERAAKQWFSPLAVHVIPKIGKTPVAEIDQRVLRDLFSPIWQAKPEVARKALMRTGLVLKHAAALGLDVDIQAVEKAKALLGAQEHVSQNVPAVHWREVPAFYETLDELNIGSFALRLTILTASRAGPVRLLHLDEIDGDVWTIPAAKLKGRVRSGGDFRLPLSPEALRVIETARPFAVGGLLFPAARGNGPISDKPMAALMKRRGMSERPHGFRSSFRDWCAETGIDRDLSERCLQHTVAGGVEAAYWRSDMLEQRRVVMDRWADHVTGGTGQLLRLRR